MLRPRAGLTYGFQDYNLGIFLKSKYTKLSHLKAQYSRVYSSSTLGCLAGFTVGPHRPHFSTMSPDSIVQYRWIDGVERLEFYQPGGYHPVAIDDLLQGRYRIVDKLGFGGYSTIWLARDETEKRYVAVKIGISTPSFPRRELEILQALRPTDAESASALPTILDAFDVRGPNGTHPCYTLTPAQGNLKEASFSRLFPIQVARALAAKLATAVAVVHSRGFVHGGECFLATYLLHDCI